MMRIKKIRFIAGKYLYIIGRKPFFWMLIVATGFSYYGLLSLFSFFSVQQSEIWPMLTLMLLISFIVQAIVLGRLTDPVEAFTLSEQPIVHTMSNSLILVLLNFLGISPLFALTLITHLMLIPYPENALTIAYTAILGLAILALFINYNYSFIFSILGSSLSLLIRPWSLSVLFFLIALLIVPTSMMARQLPHMSSIIVFKKLGFTTIYLQPIVQCLILLMPAVILIEIFFPQRRIYGIVSPYGSGFMSIVFPFDILEALLVNIVVAVGQLLPILMNLAVRYVDSHLWYVRILRRMPTKVWLLNFASIVLISFAISTPILIILNLLKLVEVKWIPLLCSTGVFAGIFALVKFERKSEVVIPIVIYFLMPPVLYSLILLFASLPGVGYLLLQPAFQELLSNVLLPVLLIALAAYLYDLPLKIKHLLIRLGVSRE